MNNQTLIEAKTWLFSKLLQRGSFEVPWHQRHYDWKSDNVCELLQDIEEALVENRHGYFLGTVILVKKNTNQWEINDGQQRMITFSLICAALCRRFADNGSVSHNEARALRILFNLDADRTCSLSDAQNYSPRISPQRDNKITYWNMIRGNSIGSNGIITRAWNEIEDFISSQSPDKSEDYFNFLVQKLEIACLEVPTEIDSNAIYETINCRGKELDDLDLIRNYIYSHFNADLYLEKRKIVHEYLERIQTQLRTPKKTSEYMRCYLQCVFGFLRKDKLYRDVRKEIKKQAEETNQNLPDYTFKLTEQVSDHKILCLFSEVIISPSPDPTTVEAFNQDCRKTNSCRNLPVFLWELHKYTVTRPLVLALLTTYICETDRQQKKRIAKTVHKRLSQLVTLTLRSAFVAPKFEPSQFEAKFSNFAKRIMQDEEIPNGAFTQFLRDCDRDCYNVWDDSKFKDKLYESHMQGASKIKRFLLGINSDQQESYRIFRETELTVEHILPKSDVHWRNWGAFEGKEPRDWINRIGNLTLLTKADNKPGSQFNRNFEKKKEIYERSTVEITSQLTDFDDWTPERIEKRQRDMVERAAKVWRFTQ